MNAETKYNNVGILFDLDGVLIDSETEYTRIWSEINRLYPTGDPEMPMRIKGMTLDKILSRYYPDKELHDRIAGDLHRLEGQMVYNWKPGARELLAWLAANGIPRALVTSSDANKMAHLRDVRPDLLPMMTAVVTANDIIKSKPDPECYLLGARLLGLEPRDCAVIEDALNGIKAGKASGAYVVGVAGTLPAKTLEPYADEIINGLDKADPEQIISKIEERRK